MGINYYARPQGMDCACKDIHIGKSSYGWRFLFYENDRFKTFPQFKLWLENTSYDIMNEDGEYISKLDLLDKIESKQKENNPKQFEYCKNVDGYRFTRREFS